MNQKVFQENEYTALKSEISSYHPDEIFVVRTRTSFTKSKANLFIESLIGSEAYTSFFDFDPNPNIEDLKKGVQLFHSKPHKLIIAIGGGSVLDMAKLISVYAHQKVSFEDLTMGVEKLNGKKTPLLAIPTTAGTGAEATHFAVLYIGKSKYSVADASILPDHIYLSSKFLATTPPYLKASTGLDAFSQAMESVWCINANETSVAYASEALSLIWNNLKSAAHGNDPEANMKMLRASYLAGKAINITKTTAPHALSYAFTSFYNIPHGHAVALTLPYFITFNYNVSDTDCNDKRGPKAVQQRIDQLLKIMNTDIKNVEQVLTDFFASVNIENKPFVLIDNFDPNTIISNVNTERLGNNPRQVTQKTLIELFQK